MENIHLEPPEKFEFPFEPYRIQHEFMLNIYKTIQEGKLGIFESPTGTGKSLSIICGALKWLKDYQNQERARLKHQIEELEAKKALISADTATDWLTTQSNEIKITQQINNLKIQQGQIIEYDSKIEKLKSNKLHASKKDRKENRALEIAKPLKPPSNPLDTTYADDQDIVIEDGTVQIQDQIDNDQNVDQYKPVKIYICSRTHSQLSQFTKEIMKSPFVKDIRVVSLASRQTYCINEDVRKVKINSLMNDKCLDMQQNTTSKDDSDGKVVKKRKTVNSKCPFYKQMNIEHLRDVALNSVEDIEDFIGVARTIKGCPYYAARLAADDAEVVLVPYNTILHKATRIANGIDIKNNILIIDEAHNLVEALTQMHNCEITLKQIQDALEQLLCYKKRFSTRFSSLNLLNINQIVFVLSKIKDFLATSDSAVFNLRQFQYSSGIDSHNMFKLVEFCKNSRLAQKVRGYALRYPLDSGESQPEVKKGVQEFLSSIKNKKIHKPVEVVSVQKSTLSTSNPLLSVISLLEALTYSSADGRLIIQKDKDDMLKSKIQFLLLNSSTNFQDVIKEARSVIVAGGTMKPISEFKQRLFIQAGADPSRIVEFSCDHIVPACNILPIVITHGLDKGKLIFNYENRSSMGGSVKSIIQELCKIVPGGIVAFFPSYMYENLIWQQIKNISLGRQVFREPKESTQVPEVLKKYSEAIRKVSSPGALLLSVVGGKLSEGLNFSDDLGRCVLVVGMPYSNISALDIKEKMSYLDKTEGAGSGRNFYENSCMKAVNQSIGRAVRHRNDYATILLVDERYTRNYVQNALPDWIKRSLKVHTFTEALVNIKDFFAIKKSS